MNSFHILSGCIKNKDTQGAMRVIRDKSEFAVRKILEKIKVRVPGSTGKPFWQWVQNWIINACRQEIITHEFHSSCRPANTAQSAYPEPDTGAAGHNQSTCSHSNGTGPLQHVVSDSSGSPPVYGWPYGLPPVHVYMGDQCSQRPRATADTGESSVGMGADNSTCIHADISAPDAVVCTEHTVRVRRRHAAACFVSSIRVEGPPRRNIFAGRAGKTLNAMQFWACRPGAGHFYGPDVLRLQSDTFWNSGRKPLTVFPEWYSSPHKSAGRHPAACHTADTGAAVDGRSSRPASFPPWQ